MAQALSVQVSTNHFEIELSAVIPATFAVQT